MLTRRSGLWLVGECSRKPKPWQNGVVESSDCTDLIARECDDEEAEGVKHAGQRITQVDTKGGLSVCPLWDEPIAAALAECNGREEPSSELSALVFQGHWRHPDPHVVGHERHRTLDIASLEGPHQFRQDLLLSRRVWSRWRLVARRDFTGQGGPCTFEGAGDSLLCGLEKAGHLSR